GVIENVPAHSSLQFEVLGSYASFVKYMGAGADVSWTWSDFYHYLELAPDTDVAALEAKFTAFSERHFQGTAVSGSEEIFTLQALADAHLYSSELEYEIGTTTNARAVWSLLIIAFFILVLAWINYVNLSSVRAIERSKEVGVRKAIGATRFQLIQQFFVEALLVNALSFAIAIGIVFLATPWFASTFAISSDSLYFWSSDSFQLYLLLGLFGLLAIGVFVSGIYPAYLLSAPQISNVLKGRFTKALSGTKLRKALVVFQFSISIALIVGTLLVSRQIRYMGQQDLGVNVEQMMTLNSPEMTAWDSTFIHNMDAFKSELTQLTGVESAATSSRSPGQGTGRIFQIQKAGENQQNYTSNFINTDFNYAATYELPVLAGRFFRSTDHNYDFRAVDKLVISEATVDMLNYNNNEAAIGKQLSFWGKQWQIVGVVPDFHQRSLHHRKEPMLFIPSYGTTHLLSLRVNAQNIDQTIAQVQTLYQDFFPGNDFEYQFLDEQFQRLYEGDLRFGRMLTFFMLLTIFIACLGLFGLASYNTFLRTKEIGIRKVLGASVPNLIALLSKDFIKLVAIAPLLAAPIAYYFMHQWLQNFAYHIEIQWWIFVLAGVIAIGIALLTVSVQSVKAALTNPVKSLRSE
ncbi:MAG: FtsX-like permease family protein, partial [Bacteroidota bacterium]